MNTFEVEYRLADDVAFITLNAPERRNALSPSMVEEVLKALDRAEQEARAIVLGATGPIFCAGADLGVSADGEAVNDGIGVLRSHFNPLIQRLRDLDRPLVASVQGGAVGFGASLALAADIIVASENAYFLQVFCNMGLVPDGGAALILAKAVGRVRASQMMLMGERLSAAQALEWGLITRCVAADALEDAVGEIARSLAQRPTRALGATRRLLWHATESDLASQLSREVEFQGAAILTEDYAEALDAFRSKRPAHFTGN